MSSVAEGDCSAPPKDRLPSEVWVLITANVVIALGYGVVAPVLPHYARNFGVSISAATFVITAFAVMRLCFAPATGVLIQRLGERRIYVSGILIVAITTGACAFAQTYWQLLLFRSLGGVGSTMFFISAPTRLRMAILFMMLTSPHSSNSSFAFRICSGGILGE